MKIDVPRSRARSCLARVFGDLVPLENKKAYDMRAASANAIYALGTEKFAQDFWKTETKRGNNCFLEKGYYSSLFSFGCQSKFFIKHTLSVTGCPLSVLPRVSHRVGLWAKVSPWFLMDLHDNIGTRKVVLLSIIDSSAPLAYHLIRRPKDTKLDKQPCRDGDHEVYQSRCPQDFLSFSKQEVVRLLR